MPRCHVRRGEMQICFGIGRFTRIRKLGMGGAVLLLSSLDSQTETLLAGKSRLETIAIALRPMAACHHQALN